MRIAGVLDIFGTCRRYRGHVDEITIARVRGWAIDMRLLPRPARIAVLVHGQVVAVSEASGSRPDVQAHGYASADCGFDIEFDLSPKDLVSNAVEIVFWDDGRAASRLSLVDAVITARPDRPQTRPWSWLKRKFGFHPVIEPTQHAGRAPRARTVDFLNVDQVDGAVPHRSILVQGPLKGDYSLAIVNRSFARALIEAGQHVRTNSINEDLSDDPLFNSDARVKDAFLENPDYTNFQIHTLNTWPPDTTHMTAGFRALHCYAWEESEFPPNFVRQFNRDLDLICVTSRYTKEALENSGVQVPVEVIGNGVDHMLQRWPKSPKSKRGPFTFLHVSSCFPRKGADVLIRAFLEEFGDQDDVQLIIKTFDNPHNYIERFLLTALGNGAIPRTIRLIKQNLSTSELYKLYISADCLVAPSRGEGFLLPAAEAMALRLPVIVTDAGGQSDFCDETTSWLVRSSVGQAATHMSLHNSFWFEPNLASLKQQMRAVYVAEPEQIRAKTDAARRRISDLYTWEKVANRFLQAVEKHRRAPGEPRRHRIAIVSTWKQECGIATYTGHLVKALSEEFDVTILAEDTGLVAEDEWFVSRVWTRTSSGIRLLCDYAVRSKFDAILIQHHLGYFSWQDLGFMVDALCTSLSFQGAVFVQLHSTQGSQRELMQIAPSLAKLSGLFVHTLDDVLSLPGLAQATRVAIIPHGISYFDRKHPLFATVESAFEEVSDSFHIGSFGFCMPHKGVLEHIRALQILRQKIPNLKATLLHSITAERKTIDYAIEIMESIKAYDLHAIIDIDFHHLPMDEILRRLSLCDLIVFPYRPNSESASGAVREVVGLGIPILCTPVSTFGDIISFSIVSEGFDPIDIADAIYSIYIDREQLNSRKRIQQNYIDRYSWNAIGKRLSSIIRAELCTGTSVENVYDRQ